MTGNLTLRSSAESPERPCRRSKPITQNTLLQSRLKFGDQQQCSSTSSYSQHLRPRTGILCVFFPDLLSDLIFYATQLKRQLQLGGHSRLKPMCETQWAECHDGVVVFVKLITAVRPRSHLPRRPWGLQNLRPLAIIRRPQYFHGHTM